MCHAQITFNDRAQCLPFGGRLGELFHTAARFFQSPRHRFYKQVIFALEMAVEAPLLQPHLAHHRSDAASVSTMLTECPRGHRKDSIVSFGLMLSRISHDKRVRPYSIRVKPKCRKAVNEGRTSSLPTA